MKKPKESLESDCGIRLTQASNWGLQGLDICCPQEYGKLRLSVSGVNSRGSIGAALSGWGNFSQKEVVLRAEWDCTLPARAAPVLASPENAESCMPVMACVLMRLPWG